MAHLATERATLIKYSHIKKGTVVKVNTNPLIKFIVKCRMFYADIRGHHGKRWDYEPSKYYMRGIRRGRNKR